MSDTPFLNAGDFLQQTLDWTGAHILTPDFTIQTALILLSLLLGFTAQRLLRPHLIDLINRATLPFRVSETLRNLTRLLFPFFALLLSGIAAQTLNTLPLELDTTAMDGAVKLILAWIIIRFVVLFIQNRFARNLTAFVIWVIAALSIFGILDETTVALDALGVNLGDFRFSALTVVKGLLALFALMYLALAAARLLDHQIGRISSLTPSSRVLISKISRVFLIITALLVGITTAGIDLSLLAVFSGAVGLGVGFGLQKGISNLFSGMLLLLDQSIKPGDIIELETSGTFGWVNHLGARYTEIVSRDNKSFLVPNEDFITQKVINWSHGDTLIRLETKFGVHYNSNPHEVKRLAEEAAARPDRVVDTPAPICHLIEFGDSSLNFSLRFWIRDAEKGVTNMRGAVMLALWDCFKEHDIQIPYPHREILVHSDNALTSASKTSGAKANVKARAKTKTKTKDDETA